MNVFCGKGGERIVVYFNYVIVVVSCNEVMVDIVYLIDRIFDMI